MTNPESFDSLNMRKYQVTPIDLEIAIFDLHEILRFCTLTEFRIIYWLPSYRVLKLRNCVFVALPLVNMGFWFVVITVVPTCLQCIGFGLLQSWGYGIPCCIFLLYHLHPWDQPLQIPLEHRLGNSFGNLGSLK